MRGLVFGGLIELRSVKTVRIKHVVLTVHQQDSQPQCEDILFRPWKSFAQHFPADMLSDFSHFRLCLSYLFGAATDELVKVSSASFALPSHGRGMEAQSF
jgi:hypothetical protein